MIVKLRKINHYISERDPHIQSYASYILLKKKLIKDAMPVVPEWRIWLSFRKRKGYIRVLFLWC
jgi:hypothetical protein